MNTAKDIDTYIATYPAATQALLQQMRDTIHKAQPGLIEAMAYGIPTFKYNDKNLVHFGGFKNHIGFYPAPQGLEAFKKELSKYKGAKGSVQFPLDEKLPLTLVTKIVKYRVKTMKEEATLRLRSGTKGKKSKK